MRANRTARAGVTLLELLVVMMILSIILTAAVKTWDVTLERGRFESTRRRLDQLATAVVGNADYMVAGQRVDFGYVGDMGRIPERLDELVVRPSWLNPDSNTWRGPYLRSTFNEAPTAYRVDGWGDSIAYDKDSLFVRSYGGVGMADRSRWLTRYFNYRRDDLITNRVQGQVLDVHGIPVPDTLFNGVDVAVEFLSPKNGQLQLLPVNRQTNGQFVVDGVSQGNQHLLRVVYIHDVPPPVETIIAQRNVVVYPGVGAAEQTVRLAVDWAVENNP